MIIVMYPVMSVDLITPQIDRLPMAVLRLLTPLGPGAGAARAPTVARGPHNKDFEVAASAYLSQRCTLI